MIRRDTTSDGVCLLTFDRPESGANIFDAATLADLSGHVEAIEKDQKVRGVILISAKKSIFIAGADLQTLLRQARSGQMRAFIAEGQAIFSRLAALNVPTVAAIHGACAGGGYEVTLACDYRIASDDPATRVGLPETTLGLVPAWGGATRLPRLIGIEAAAKVILKGKLYPTAEALKLGMVDEVVPREALLDAAKKNFPAGNGIRRRFREVRRDRASNPISMSPPNALSRSFGLTSPSPTRCAWNLMQSLNSVRPMPPKT